MEKILVLFLTTESGIILDGIGPAIEEELQYSSSSELFWGPNECPNETGLWVWEGYPKFFPDEFETGQYEFIGGTWRLPTDREWAVFKLANTFQLIPDNITKLPNEIELTEDRS